MKLHMDEYKTCCMQRIGGSVSAIGTNLHRSKPYSCAIDSAPCLSNVRVARGALRVVDFDAHAHCLWCKA